MQYALNFVRSAIPPDTIVADVAQKTVDGKPRAILGHNLTFAALGVFILWFCWFGFNGASTVGMDSDALGGLTASQPAVIPTSPANAALYVMETSGFLYRIHVKINVVVYVGQSEQSLQDYLRQV